MTVEQTIFPFLEPGSTAEPDIAAMGRKGANLLAMTRGGFPVPPGFVISTFVGKRIAGGEEAVGQGLREGLLKYVERLEEKTGRQLGAAENALLISVRSGAAVSMPGMMDTVLNLGLNRTNVASLARETGDERFAWDTYRRFISSFANVVLDVPMEEFEAVLHTMRERESVERDSDLSTNALVETSERFLSHVKESTGSEFPQSADLQLQLALLAVFNSWNTQRARTYRTVHGLAEEAGTACVVQAMVFGNRDQNSLTGVFTTRHAGTGDKRPSGEFLINAQGEDIVSGIRTPHKLTEAGRLALSSSKPSMEANQPEIFAQLVDMGTRLENHFAQVQEIEFTVEQGKLYLLQTRPAKLDIQAAIRIAVDMVYEGLLTREQAVERVNLSSVKALTASRVNEQQADPIWAKGMPASPGAVCGRIALSSQRAVEMAGQGEDVILLRKETDPNDIQGMHASVGILTGRGGAMSHAAQVALGMGKPCVVGARTLRIDEEGGACSSMGRELREHDLVTIDGGSGAAYAGKQALMEPEPSTEAGILLSWA